MVYFDRLKKNNLDQMDHKKRSKCMIFDQEYK
jgi:hypothetical protein